VASKVGYEVQNKDMTAIASSIPAASIDTIDQSNKWEKRVLSEASSEKQKEYMTAK
jgi:hypothetical protein